MIHQLFKVKLNKILKSEDPQGESRSDDAALPLALDSIDEQGTLDQTSEEVNGDQGALGESSDGQCALGAPSDDVGVSGTSVKRRAVSVCKQKMRQWCAQLNQ